MDLEDEQEKLQARLKEVQARNDELEKWQVELEEEVKQKEKALEALKNMKVELGKRLKDEIKRGEVLIKEIRGELIVDVNDRILFRPGEAFLNERGREVLRRVGEALNKTSDKLIQVGGHTDSRPISERLKERFASNWELSTARATQVVRFLQDEVKIPGERLLAAGFSQYRPVASNSTRKGRRLNRRIEIKLLPIVEGK